MKKLFLALLFLYATNLFAQKTNVIVEGISPNLYLTHIVTPRENYYSIGRLYNQHPRNIASFNNASLDKGLAIGQTLKIPLNELNYDVTGESGNGETLMPVYHIVTKNETLFRIGNNHASPLEGIRKWNNLSSDVIEIGTPLVIGYLRVKNEHLAAFKALPAGEVTVKIAPASQPLFEQPAATEPVSKTEQQPVAIVEEVVDHKAGTNGTPLPVAEEPNTATAKVEAPPVGPAAKPIEEVREREPAPAPVEAVTEREPENPLTPAPTAPVQSVSRPTPVSAIPTPVAEEGAFAGGYSIGSEDGSLVNKVGEAGTFKSTSGWQDKKYYVLIDDVQPGTIVKISTEHKTLYAKVLGNLPETKDSKNMLLRMSSAAASYLGIIDPKFQVQVSYYQ